MGCMFGIHSLYIGVWRGWVRSFKPKIGRYMLLIRAILMLHLNGEQLLLIHWGYG